jgi:tRNA pseudouridine55 synthase
MTAEGGVLLLDKPAGPTSRAVIDAVAARLRLGAVGHAGTLDPLATGLLVTLIGKARRLQEFFAGHDKRYRARVRFGATTATCDAEGELVFRARPEPIERAAAVSLLAGFVGELVQTPPSFSALRIDGKRAHALARDGRPAELPPRPVRVTSIDLVAIEGDDWVLDVDCGPGYYVRALARDLGERRGTGAYLADLRRIRSGGFAVDIAVAPAQARQDDVIPITRALAGETRIDVTGDEARALAHGKAIPAQPGAAPPAFAWRNGRPCFKLCAPAPGILRSDLLIEDPGER